jgi:hypothetical protein
MGSLIEAVNLLGSFFYGGMPGVFILAFFFRRVRGGGVFLGRYIGEAAIFATSNVSQTPPSVLVTLRGGRGARFGCVANAFVACRPALVTEWMSSSPTTDMLGQEEIK